MRCGEVLGLAWRDLDLDHNRLSVRQAVITVEYQVTIADVKTGTARRNIDLDDRTVAPDPAGWFDSRRPRSPA